VLVGLPLPDAPAKAAAPADLDAHNHAFSIVAMYSQTETPPIQAVQMATSSARRQDVLVHDDVAIWSAASRSTEPPEDATLSGRG
jgi:hypothetical protein